MSRVDYLTIGIVSVCLIALGFLIFKTVKLMGGSSSGEAVKEAPYQDTSSVDPYSSYDYSDTTAHSKYSDDEDLDDDQVSPYEETTPPATSSKTETSKGSSSKTQTATKPAPKPASQTETKKPAATTDNTSRPSTTSSSSSTGDYLVIAGTFSQKSNAEAQVKKLIKLGYTNASAENFDRGSFTVALVDRFSSLAEAQKLEKELKAKGIDVLVKKKQ